MVLKIFQKSIVIKFQSAIIDLYPRDTKNEKGGKVK
jgi:hypothetical protein